MHARALSGRAASSRAAGAALAPLRPRASAAPAARAAAAPAGGGAPLPEALLFDCDGVIVDTEKDGHRVSFNEAFKLKGLDHDWGVELYGELLEIGGGKERMTKYFADCADREPFLSTADPAARSALVKDLHLLKTDLFMRLVETGAMPLRPGVARLVGEAIAAGVPVAVCSTSNERAVSTIVRVMLGEDVAKVMRVFAGDVVPKKKPDPAIYLLAAKELGVDPKRCVVVEDSRIGLRAAKSAGMTCVVTKSSYTGGEDFTGADRVVESLDAGGVTLAGLAELLAAAAATAAA
ncbi:hypothetical protein Rsub_10442 [Raphidocelis subcapitata]|uniref:Phosphatase n=1 Tax=Raphidocelis subcapitata TaxID=307507 RepID=A0A2V0PDD3_9CHLO|nr:hypothetical protein Rsub_10442 [Raphidocelis subcapitata]|eukprot:GBF97519.1 hypothetical protein Rsub_10442 [Raphidocelis subcapitata]